MPSHLTRASTTQGIQAPRPTYSYREHTPPPTCQYITTPDELDNALEDFEGPYGFDCEYKALPVPHPTALIQLSNTTKILLIHVSAFTEFPEKLKALLEDSSVKKIGHYTESDGEKLRDDYGVLPKSLINLMPLARQVDPKFLAMHPPVRNVTLAQLVLFYLDRTLPKGPVRVSNWELRPLTNAQQEYAASDAYCAYEVYTRLMALQKENAIELDPSAYTINIQPRTSAPPKVKVGKYYIERTNPKLSKFEFDAYTLWYHGYTTVEILTTFGGMFPMERMRGYFDGEGAIISFIVAALRKDTSLSFDPITLRAMVSSDAPSWEKYRAFIEERCSLESKLGSSTSTPVQEKSKAASSVGRKRKLSDVSEDSAPPAHDLPPTQSREATPEQDLDADAPESASTKTGVKRARTM